MSAVRVDLNLAVIRRENGYGFALIDSNGIELATIGEGAMPHEIRTWLADCLGAIVAPVLADQFCAAYRAVKTG